MRGKAWRDSLKNANIYAFFQEISFVALTGPRALTESNSP